MSITIGRENPLLDRVLTVINQGLSLFTWGGLTEEFGELFLDLF